MIRIKHRGKFGPTLRFFNRMMGKEYLNMLDKYGEIGVDALRSATPIDSGETAASWSYEIELTKDKTSISWINTNENQNVLIAILIQYGHGTATGGYVKGFDFINPSIRPVFDSIQEAMWAEVTGA